MAEEFFVNDLFDRYNMIRVAAADERRAEAALTEAHGIPGPPEADDDGEWGQRIAALTAAHVEAAMALDIALRAFVREAHRMAGR